MLLANALRLRRSAVPGPVGAARPPLTLTGSPLHAAQVLWVIVAAGALVLWFVEILLYYQAALELRNADGMTSLSREEWRVGLQQLGLSPAFYAGWAVAGICLQIWPMLVIGALIVVRPGTLVAAARAMWTWLAFRF